MIVSLHVTTADRSNANETYQFYITTFQRFGSLVYSRWDLCAFPQIAADANVYHTMFLTTLSDKRTVTTADPGVQAVLSGSFATVTAGAGHGIRTTTAGMVSDGVMGEGLAYSLVGGGTTPGPITFELVVSLIGI